MRSRMMKLVAVAAPMVLAAFLAGCGDDTVTSCGKDQTMCNGVCVFLQSDEANCKTCGTKCATGETCNAGVCGCGGTTTSCSGKCVTTASDPENCGTCGTKCAAGQSCNAGKCGTCDPPKLDCTGACIDPQSDNANCGTCGTKCDTTKGSLCTAGKCVCVAGMTDCAGTCVFTASDPKNCGSCGKACAASESCNNGGCGGCTGGKTSCSGSCVDVQSDNTNCGICGTKCDTAAGLNCVAGKCGCVGGLTSCGTPAKCVDTNGDKNNCGTCGTVCPTGQSCIAGACKTGGCLGTQVDCNGLCVDTKSDINNCGTCGVKCTGGKTCTNSLCGCATGQTDCSGTCANLTTDVNNCGACGTKCATGQVCTIPTGGTTPSCQTICPTGQKACAGSCVTIASDPNNCTDCGIKCTGGKICNNGCVCPTGQNDCSGTCVNFQNDDKHCGNCTKVCTSSETCQAGACVAANFTQLQITCGSATLPMSGKTQCTANGVLPSGTTVPLTTDTKLTWNAKLDPTSPVGCAALIPASQGGTCVGVVGTDCFNIGSFSTTTKGELTAGQDTKAPAGQFAALGCRIQASATYVGSTQTITSNNVNITIRDKKITGVTITPNNPTVPALSCLGVKFRIFVSYDSGETLPLTAIDAGNGESVTWLNMNPAVGTFGPSGGGLLFSNSGALAVGTAEIRATVVLGGTTYNISTNLTVVAATVTSLAIVPKAPAAVAAGNTIAFNAVATFNNSTQLDVTNFENNDPYVPYGGCSDANIYHLSGSFILPVPTNPGVLTFNNTTKKYEVVFTAGTVPTGSATPDVVRASWLGWNDDANVTVSGSILVSCVIRTANTTVTPGTLPAAVPDQLNGTTWPKGLLKKKTYTFGRYSNGDWADITDGVAWTSSAPNIAQVNNTAGAKGEIDMLLAGTATISSDPTALRAGVPVCTAGITVATAQVCKLYVLPRYRNDSPNEYRRAFQGAGGGSDPHVGTANGPAAAGFTTLNQTRPVLPNENGFPQRFGATAFYCTIATGTQCPAIVWPSLPPTGTSIPANCYPVDVTTSATWSVATATTAPALPAGLAYSGTQGLFNTVRNTVAANYRREDVVEAEVPLAEGSPTMVTGTINTLVCGDFVANALKLYARYTDNIAVCATDTSTLCTKATPANRPKGTDYRYHLVNPFKSALGVCDFFVSPAIGGAMTNGYLLNVGEEATAWNTTPAGIASVNTAANSKGNLRADALGTTSVTGTYNGNTTNLDFIVGDPVVTSCTITPTSGSMIAHSSYIDSIQFTATATYSDGTKQNQTAAATWDDLNAATAGSDSPCAEFGTGADIGRLFAASSVGSACPVYITATIGGVTCTPCSDGGCPTPVTARPVVTVNPATVAAYFLQIANLPCFGAVTIPTVSVNTSVFLKGCIKWSNGSIVEDMTGPSLWISPQPTVLQFAGKPETNWARFNALTAAEPVTVTAQVTIGTQTFNPTMTIPVSATPITAVSLTNVNHKNVLPGSVCGQLGSQYEYCMEGTGALNRFQVLGTRAGLPAQDLTFMTAFTGTPSGCDVGGAILFESPFRQHGFAQFNVGPLFGSPDCDAEISATTTFVDTTQLSIPALSGTVRILNGQPGAGLAITVTPNTLAGAGKTAVATAVVTLKVGTLFVPVDMTGHTIFTNDAPQAIWMNSTNPYGDPLGRFEHSFIVSRAVSASTPVKIIGDLAGFGLYFGQTTLTINP